MKQYDICVPLYNNGSAIEPRKFQDLQNRLLDFFEGLSFFPQPIEGFWKLEHVTYRDEIVIYRVLSAKGRPARRFLVDLKKDLKKAFKQDDILILEREVGSF